MDTDSLRSLDGSRLEPGSLGMITKSVAPGSGSPVPIQLPWVININILIHHEDMLAQSSARQRLPGWAFFPSCSVRFSICTMACSRGTSARVEVDIQALHNFVDFFEDGRARVACPSVACARAHLVAMRANGVLTMGGRFNFKYWFIAHDIISFSQVDEGSFGVARSR